jgi:hypothetical protein
MAARAIEISSRSLRRRVLRTVQLAAIRTGRGQFRAVWAAAYDLLVRVLARLLRRGSTASVYVKGSFGRGEPVLGLSDIGLIAVVPAGAGRDEDACAAVQDRWQRLARSIPPLAWLVRGVPVYSETELPGLASTCFRYGLDASPARSLFFGPSRSTRLATLPGLWPMQDWKLVSGPDRRPPVHPADPSQRRLAAWLELQFWWSLAFRAAAEPDAHWAPYLCVKLIAEPARILLWLERGERHVRRVDVLRHARDAFPEEHEAIEFALGLERELGRVGLAPLASVMPGFVRLSSRVARWLEADLAGFGEIEVVLAGLPPADHAPVVSQLPLCDWRALVRAPSPEEWLVIQPGRIDDPAALARALIRSSTGRHVVFVHDGLILHPSADAPVTRAATFAGCDPVTTALASGASTAVFPDVPGWSAADTAARAVAEHRAWLRSRPRLTEAAPDRNGRQHLAGLFSAARVALFRQTIGSREPSLPVTFAETADRLAEGEPGARAAIAQAHQEHAGGGRTSVSAHDALAGVVTRLSCYRES